MNDLGPKIVKQQKKTLFLPQSTKTKEIFEIREIVSRRHTIKKLTIEQSSLLLERLPPATTIFAAATLFLSFNRWYFIHVYKILEKGKKISLHGQIMQIKKKSHTTLGDRTDYVQIHCSHINQIVI